MMQCDIITQLSVTIFVSHVTVYKQDLGPDFNHFKSHLCFLTTGSSSVDHEQTSVWSY